MWWREIKGRNKEENRRRDIEVVGWKFVCDVKINWGVFKIRWKSK